MRSLLVLVAACVAACAAHPAAAQGPATLDASVGGLLVDGHVTLTGPLAAVASTGQVEPGKGPLALLAPATADTRLAPTELRLTAHRLHVETDVQRQSGSPAVGTPQHTTEVADFADAVAHTTSARGKFQFYLAPLPGRAPPILTIDAEQARLQPVAAAVPEPDRKVTTPRAALRAAEGAATVASGGLRTLHLQGDLVLTLWEWDLAVSSDGTLLRSGYAYAPTLPSVHGVDTVGDSEERQVFVVAEDASLDLTLPYDAAVAVAVQPRSASIDGRTVLENPSGHLTILGGDRDLRDGDWVDGAFAATLSDPTASSFHATLQGSARQAHLAGLTVAIASPPPSATGTLVATLAASGVAVLGTWRLWGRRAAAVPAGAPASDAGEDDELRTLRWLQERSAQDRREVLWDSDLMRALDWSAERAQGALRGLQTKGQVRGKEVAMAPGRSSLGHITLTAAGADRLRAGPGGGAGGHRTGLRRLVPGR